MPIYRAVLEVYVSFYERDEFWYTNPPDEYLVANNYSDVPLRGSFRKVVAIDGNVVVAVWPFTVIYTGGFNSLLWKPIRTLLDGKNHLVGFSVTNALNVWFIDANLHLWLDGKSIKTEGRLVDLVDKPLAGSTVSDFEGVDGSFWTNSWF
ncbi:hypothetical protein Fmac_011100 [Flemingia macrophylla]|uniref:Peptide N-acetyl-beta-D-glucosaminyl asparaginase amidase A N-terminal domain-containing protein n=1 Tax=Flemingia macrophylla TaxID=520843 RepID=A0ABD1MLH8_9FABA